MKKLKLISLALIFFQIFGAASACSASFKSRFGKNSSRLGITNFKSYKSFEEALDHCQKGGYEDKDIVEVVSKKNALLQVQIESNPIIDNASLRAIAGVALALSGNELRVIDFGGGGGNLYTIARRVLDPKIKLHWNVVETQAMVEAAKFLENDELKFFSDIQIAVNDLGTVDLVLTSGALQCCKDPYVSLQNLVAVQAKYLFITRTSFNYGSETLIIIQKSLLSQNGPGPIPINFVDKVVLYPNVFIPIDQVEAALRSTYNIRFRSVEAKDVYRIGKVSIDMYGYFCEKKV